MEAMWLIMQQDTPDNYVIATGETHSVREFVELAFAEVGIKLIWQGSGVEEKWINGATGQILVEIDPRYFRLVEVEVLQGNPLKARQALGWEPRVTFLDLIKMMVTADFDEAKKELYLKNHLN